MKKKFTIKKTIATVVVMVVVLIIGLNVFEKDYPPLIPLPILTSSVVISPAEGMISQERYTPGTETLAADEMRIVALGTGMPSARPKQAAACFLVELGNGEKFLFDVGSESYSRILAQKIPADKLDKVFLSHLHVDHFGDLPAFWLGSSEERRVPLRVWGPSGDEPKYGSDNALDLMQKVYAWDLASRKDNASEDGLTLQVNEFSFGRLNEVIYNENDVVIRTFPAPHGLDGCVSYVLEWNGLTFAFSGDTIPSQWWVDYTKGVDIAVHESFLASALLMKKQGFNVLESLNVGTQGHTSPEQFGKVMSMTKPRLAVGYHFYNDADTAPEMRHRIAKTYNGDLALAEDFMVFNVTKDNIRVRMSDGVEND